jgi:hypothetical protein
VAKLTVRAGETRHLRIKNNYLRIQIPQFIRILARIITPARPIFAPADHQHVCPPPPFTDHSTDQNTTVHPYSRPYHLINPNQSRPKNISNTNTTIKKEFEYEY